MKNEIKFNKVYDPAIILEGDAKIIVWGGTILSAVIGFVFLVKGIITADGTLLPVLIGILIYVAIAFGGLFVSSLLAELLLAFAEHLKLTRSIAHNLSKLGDLNNLSDLSKPSVEKEIDEKQNRIEPTPEEEKVEEETETEEQTEEENTEEESARNEVCEMCGKEGKELFWHTENCGWYMRNRRLCKHCMEIAEYNEKQMKK